MGRPHPSIPGLEISGGGFITSIDGKSVGSAPLETKYLKRALTDLAEPIVQGYATKFLKVHWHQQTRQYEVFVTGCFATSLASGRPIRILASHEEIELIATTSDRLELLADDIGLAFRLRLRPDDERDMTIARDVALGDLAECSVGYTVNRERQIVDGSFSVRAIDDVDLKEISLVRAGAVPETRAVLVEGARRWSLREDLRRGSLFVGAWTPNDVRQADFDAAGARFKKSLSDLSRRLSEVCA